MSAFGDNTPAQDIYDWIKYVSIEYGLTEDEVIVILVQIINYIVNIGGLAFEKIQKKGKTG